MTNREINIRNLKIASCSVNLLAVTVVLIFAGTGEALALASGGVYCLVTIQLYEHVVRRILEKVEQKTALFVLLVLLKVLFVSALLRIMLDSSLASYFPWLIGGILSFVPGSLILLGWNPDSPCS